VYEDLRAYLPPPKEASDKPIKQSLCEWASDGEREIMMVNDIGLQLNCPLHHYASLHAGHLLKRFDLRKDYGLSCGGTVLHSDQAYTVNGFSIDVVWPFGPVQIPHLLSGGFAVLVGLALGYDRIVMAGCPNNGTGRFLDEPEQVGAYEHPKVMERWQDLIEQYPEIRARVRSMSGNTRQWLGGPEA